MSRLDGAHLSSGVVTQVASGIAGSGGATAVAVYQPMVLLVAVGVVLVLVVGVVLPAVWSRKKERRAAAVRVLRELLAPIRPTIPKPAALSTAPSGSSASENSGEQLDDRQAHQRATGLTGGDHRMRIL